MCMILGLVYPIYAAAFGFVFVLGRVAYSIGWYVGTPTPNKRLPGFFLTVVFGIWPLVCLNIAAAGKVLTWW